jgi:uncharacterized protein YjiS (DUF1127 family)
MERRGRQLGFECPRKGDYHERSTLFQQLAQVPSNVTELGRMSTRELHDLGIDRGDIRNVARAAIVR